MRAYIIKYALTKGIFVTDDAQLVGKDGMIEVDKTLYNRDCWTRTPQEAQLRAEQARQKKLHSLQVRMDKVKQINFGNFRDYKDLRV